MVPSCKLLIYHGAVTGHLGTHHSIMANGKSEIFSDSSTVYLTTLIDHLFSAKITSAQLEDLC